MYEELKERIKKHEGFRDTIYLDSLGKKTIGYGHLITPADKFKEDKRYSIAELNRVYEYDFKIALDGARRITDFDNLHPKAQEVAIECCFVLGAKGFSCFKRTLRHLNEGSYSMASKELKDSLWFKKQATNRVQALCNILEDIK
ncbi:lysozyme [uncultured Mediterranean phage]|nr:lysozyme [uncultured Mediterranean phage]